MAPPVVSMKTSGDERRARRHEALVKLVRRGVKKNQQQGAADFRPRPCRQVVFGHVQPGEERRGSLLDGIEAIEATVELLVVVLELGLDLRLILRGAKAQTRA